MAKLTIGNKMLLSAGSLVTMSMLLGTIAFMGISGIGDRLNAALGAGMKKDLLAHQIEIGESELVSNGRGEVVRGFLHDAAGVESLHRQAEGTASETQADLVTLDSTAKPEAKRDIAEIRRGLSVVSESEQEMHDAIVSGDLVRAGKLNTETFSPAAVALGPAVADLLKIQDQVFAAEGEQAATSVNNSRLVCLVALTICLALGAVIFLVVRDMNHELTEDVTELAGSISQIASAASQVASSSQTMAQGASEQAATIEETSSASAEINSMAQRNTENSRTTAEIVTGAQMRTEQTNRSLNEMVEAMDGINSSSQKISKIIKVIDEIAFQTNILALNAAVEAARAGDAGKGFAVVADEVRNLAQRSAQAAKDTATLIEESIQRSNGGKMKVDQVADGIHTVNGETGKIKVLVDEINLGSLEQSRGIDQISRSITEMEQVTQSNAASAQQSAAAAGALSAQAQGMRIVVNRLTEMVGVAVGPGLGAISPRASALAAARMRPAVAFRPAARASSAHGSPARRSPFSTGSNFPMDDDFKEF